MTNITAKALAVYLAAVQLFSSGFIDKLTKNKVVDLDDVTVDTALSETIPKAGKINYVLVESSYEMNPVFMKNNHETGECEVISIFDKDNIPSHQYGASQEVFRSNFRQLINDPYIWEEMQKYYPVESFTTKEEAMFFYEKYFDIIRDCGCGYAAATNYVFQSFEGHEDEFYEKLGFPMYTVSNNQIDFNYELFMLKFFNYSNLKVINQRKNIENSMARSMAEFRLKDFERNNTFKTPDKKEMRTWSEEEWEKFYNSTKEMNNKKEQLQELVSKSKDVYYNFGISTETKFDYLASFLRQYKVYLSTSLSYNLRGSKENDIFSSDIYTLYPVDSNGNLGSPKTYDDPREDHYMYITDISDNGDIYVSSWGEKYLINNSNRSEINRIRLKRNK